MHPVEQILRAILAHDHAAADRLARDYLHEQPDDPVVLALRSYALGNLLLGELPPDRRQALEEERLAHAGVVLEHLRPDRFTEDETIRQIQRAAVADAHAAVARQRYDRAGSARELDEALALALAGEQACGLTRPLLEVQALCLLRLGREREAQELVAQVIGDPPETTRAFLEDVARARAGR